MNFVKNITSRANEFIGNAFNHSSNQNAVTQEQMPDSVDTEIALHGSRPARNRTRTSRAPRVKAQVPINVLVKSRIYEGDYKNDPLEIEDDEDEIEEISPPKSLVQHARRGANNSERQQQGSRTLGQSRSAAAAEEEEEEGKEEEEEERLLGPQRRRSSTQAKGVIIQVPTLPVQQPQQPLEDMASRPKKKFLASPYNPVYTLSQGKSAHIFQHRAVNHKASEVTPRGRGTTPRKSVSSYNHEAEGSPPRKKPRTDVGPPISHNQQPTTIDFEADELHSGGVMRVSERTKKSPMRSSVKDTPLRNINQTTSHHSAVSGLSIKNTAGFTQNATTQRRQEEARQSSRPSQSSTATSSTKILTTPGASKMDRRLNGNVNEPESPDSSCVDTPTINLLSPPAPPEPDYARYNLNSFFCLELNTDADDPNCFVLIRPQCLEIRYRNEVLSKDALFSLPYSKIRMCKMEDEEEDAAMVQLCLRGGTSITSNLCFLTFKSPKQCYDFVSILQQHWHNYKIVKSEPGWLGNALRSARALGNDVSKAARAQLEKRLHPDRLTDDEALRPDGESNAQPRRRIGRLDPNDKPPEQDMTESRYTDAEKLARARRTPRSRLSKVQAYDKNTLSEYHDAGMSMQDSKRTRSRSAQQLQLDTDEAPRPKPEPRVTGNPWDKPLTYPSTGSKKQTIEWADLKRLEDEELLNDSIVGLFLRYIQENADKVHSQHIHTMSTFFYETLMRPTDGKTSRKQINYAAVSKWTKSVDIFSREFVIVPINESLHWYTLLICNLGALTIEKVSIDLASSDDDNIVEGQVSVPGDFPKEASKDIIQSDLTTRRSDDEYGNSECEAPKAAKRGPKRKALRAQRRYDVTQPIIITLDSLDTGGRSSTASMLKDYVIEEGKQKRGLEVDKTRIKGMTAKGIPHQGNFYDCGLYVCLYLERFMANPRKFVDAVLTRENSALPWPRRLSSSKMRQRFYDFLQELYRAQETGEDPNVPEIGKILVRDEDYNEPEPKPMPPTKQPGELNLEEMKKGLEYAENYYKPSGRDHYSDQEAQEHRAANPDDYEAADQFFSSVRDFVDRDNAPTIIGSDDDESVSKDEHKPAQSPYFALPNVPRSPPVTKRIFNLPQQLASNLRERRETARRQKIFENDAIDLTSPAKQQRISEDADTEREDRCASVSTEYLFSDKSYEDGSDETVRPGNEPQQSRHKVSPTKRSDAAIVVINSQPESTDDVQNSRSSKLQQEGYAIGDDLFDVTRHTRHDSIVPESQEGDADDDVVMIDARPAPVHKSLQGAVGRPSNDAQDIEMLLK